MKTLKFYKRLIIEIIETLCTFCLFMNTESRKYGCNSLYSDHFRDHYNYLKTYSDIMRGVKK